jgi:hypothetical protein
MYLAVRKQLWWAREPVFNCDREITLSIAKLLIATFKAAVTNFPSVGNRKIPRIDLPASEIISMALNKLTIRIYREFLAFYFSLPQF